MSQLVYSTHRRRRKTASKPISQFARIRQICNELGIDEKQYHRDVKWNGLIRLAGNPELANKIVNS